MTVESNSIQVEELVGQRVTLRRLREEDTGALYKAGNYAEIWPYMTSYMQSEDDMHNFVTSALAGYALGLEVPFVILDHESGSLVGSTRYLDISRVHRQLEIGFTWLTPSVWRTKVNTECKYLLMKYAFENLEMIRVQLKTDRRNTRSQQAIERLGAVKEGILRSHRILPDGYVRDSVYYSVIQEEWPGVKERLQGLLN